MSKKTKNYDMDNDGRLSETEIDNADHLLEIELKEEKADTQRRMAWVAMGSMVVFTMFLFSPFVTDGRVQALADLLGLFYIAQAGVVGAYMGVTAWMSNSSSPRSSSYSSSSYSSRPSSYSSSSRSTTSRSVVAPDPD